MTSLKSPLQGHASPAPAQTSDYSTHPHHSTASNAQGSKPQEQAPGSTAPECRASPSGTTSTAPNVASSYINHAAVLLSPAPSEEVRTPVVIFDSPAETEARALEPTSAGTETARFSPVPLADTPAQPPTSAETHQGTGMATGEGDNSNRQATVSSKCQQWLDELYRYVNTRAGVLQPLEKHRIYYLRDALVLGDEFCVIVHEFLVLWHVDVEKGAELLRLPRPILDAACKVFENALGGATSFRSEVVEWMVDFPFSLRSEGCASTIAMDVGNLFRRLAIQWDNLTYFVKNSKVPLRHRELLGVLNLRSQTLRLALFRWSRWFLGVESTPENASVIVALEEKFKEDQDFYLNPRHGEEEFREHDARLAHEYGAIVRAAHIGGREFQEIAGRPISGSSVSAQGQQVRSPVQQGLRVPQEHSRKRPRAEADEQDGQPPQARQDQQYAHLQRPRQLAPEWQAQILQAQQTQPGQQVQQVRQVQRVPPRQAQQERQEQHSRPQQGQQEQKGRNPGAQQGHPQYSLYTQQQAQLQSQINAQMTANQALAMGQLQGPLQLPQQEIPHYLQPQFQANSRWQQQQQQQQMMMMMQGQHQIAQRELQLLQHANTQSYLQQQQRRLAQAHQQSQHKNPCSHVGSWRSSSTHAVPYSSTGQTQADQAMAWMARIQQLQVQSQTFAAVQMGQGIAAAKRDLMPSHRPVHGGGTVVNNSNSATPTANSPVSHHPSVEQHTRLGSTASPVQTTPIQPQPQGVINTRFAPHSWSVAAAQNSPRGPAPTQAFPSPSSRPQSTVPSDAPQAHKDTFHQYIEKLLAGPTRLPTNAARVKFEFDIEEPGFKMLSHVNSQGGRNMYGTFEGCRRVRFRICTRTVRGSAEDAPILESEWVAAPVAWPGIVTVKVNDNGFVDIPRKRVFGRDMPCEINAFLKEGRNLVSVVVPSGAPPNQEFFGAIELVDTATHEGIIERAIAQRCMPDTETVALIKKRLAVEDDDIQVLDPTINISVADPISTRLVEVPCRGAACRHLDAFDLRAMLESRLPKRCPHGGPSASCAECAARPHGWQRTGPVDGWRCPICGGDVRPGNIVVDGFLKGVVEKMKAEKSVARAVTVDAEGVWRVKAEDKAEKKREVIMIDD